MSVRIITGDLREKLAELPADSFDCCVTSPPFFRQRDYLDARQMGREPSVALFAEAMAAALEGVRRVLRTDGSLWLQLGDSYAASGNGGGGSLVAKRRQWTGAHERKGQRRPDVGYKDKDITLAPFAVANACREAGWYLRSVIIWDKMVATEPPRLDRPSTAHEYIFLLAKSKRCQVRDPGEAWFRSTVWTVRPGGNDIDHPALMAPEVVRRCIVAGSRHGGTVLDPFGGAGTTGMVADRLGRHCTLIELNPSYAAIAERRLHADAGMFATVEAA